MVAALTAFALALAALSVAAPARALVVTVAGHRYGVNPIGAASSSPSIPGARVVPATPRVVGQAGVKTFDATGPLSYHGGPVMHSVTTHVIYWDPNKEFTETTKGIVDKFFTDVAHDSGLPTNVFAVAGQYTDGSGNAAYSSTLAGTAVDGTAYPSIECTIPSVGFADPGPYTHCITDEELATELSEYIAKHGLPTGPAQQYFVLLPHSVVTCLETEVCSNNTYCAYHSFIGSGTEQIVYSDIPFSLLDAEFAKSCQADGNPELQLPNGDNGASGTRFADVALKYVSHEYIEAATDPNLNAWFDAEGHEIGDKCNVYGETAGNEVDPNAFLPTLGGVAAKGTLFDQSINAHHYYLQSEWDNGAQACSMKPVPLSGVGFTSSSNPVVGTPVSFSATATDDYGAPRFSWTFGDGGSASGSAPSHAYAAPGSYKVTMTAKDALTGATAAPVEHTIVVSDSQTIRFESTPPNPAVIGGIYVVKASASSGLPVSLSSATPSVCSLSGSSSGATATFKTEGTCTIDANQPGNAEWEPAKQESQTFAVNRKPQAVKFETTPPSPGLVGGSYNVSATGGASGNPVTLTIDATSSSVCSISGATVSFHGEGTCTIDANQAGNATYEAAPQKQQSFSVASKQLSVETPPVVGGNPSQPAAGSITSSLAPVSPLPPSSAFGSVAATIDERTGTVTLTESLSGAGTFSWLLTFQNGRFGVFAASNSKCKAGFVRLQGKCRPARVVYSRGSRAVASRAVASFTIKPTSAGLAALRRALKQKRGLPVLATLTFTAAGGGAPVTHAQSLVVRLKH